MFVIYIALLFLTAKHCTSQDDEGPYRGKFIGKLNSYHHQVSGDVYAVNERTLLLAGFSYDGLGEDTYFWGGDSDRPGPRGWLLPDERGRTDVLPRYQQKDVTLTLPAGRRTNSLRWFAVFDVTSQAVFADVSLPDEFEFPKPRSLPPLVGDGVRSGPVVVEDDATILIQDFHYKPTSNASSVYFWVGSGPQPSVAGRRIPDEYGYLEPLQQYSGIDVRLHLPGGDSLRSLSWFALWDVDESRPLAHIPLPEELDVPPALSSPVTLPSTGAPLAHCKQLHNDLQVAWEVFGGQITLELRGRIGADDYMSFGLAGDDVGAPMLKADVAIVHYDEATSRGLAEDYGISERTACVNVLGEWRGVCKDTSDDIQVLSGGRADGVTAVRYRRSLAAGPEDRSVPTDGPARVIWAMGPKIAGRPDFHYTYPKEALDISFGDSHTKDTCVPFTTWRGPELAQWERAELSEPSLRTFTFSLGPGGGERAGHSPPLVWYVNGHLRPALQLRRGALYEARVRGGNEPRSADRYHPLVISKDPVRADVGVLAGVQYTRRGMPVPAAAGPLCVARALGDRRRLRHVASFRAYNASLVWTCDEGEPAVLKLAPNTSWPDRVYYHSFTHAGMGGIIDVVDRHKRGLSRRNAAPPFAASPLVAALLALLVASR